MDSDIPLHLSRAGLDRALPGLMPSLHRSLVVLVVDYAETLVEYTVCSWNVDGLRAPVWEWLRSYLLTHRPHVWCLNETKRTEAALHTMLAQVSAEYAAVLNCHRPAHMHGVAVLIRRDVPYRVLPCPIKCAVRSDTKSTDAACGRVLAIEVAGKFNVVATYSPNAGVDRSQPLKNLAHRLREWDPALFALLEQMRATQPTVWIGDINVAPTAADVSDPKTMARWAGFTQEERVSLAGFLKSGHWLDIWRRQHRGNMAYTYRGKPGKWRSSFGLRLDNCIVSADLEKAVTKSFLITDCAAPTDHIPIGIKLKR